MIVVNQDLLGILAGLELRESQVLWGLKVGQARLDMLVHLEALASLVHQVLLELV